MIPGWMASASHPSRGGHWPAFSVSSERVERRNHAALRDDPGRLRLARPKCVGIQRIFRESWRTGLFPSPIRHILCGRRYEIAAERKRRVSWWGRRLAVWHAAPATPCVSLLWRVGPDGEASFSQPKAHWCDDAVRRCIRIGPRMKVHARPESGSRRMRGSGRG